MPLVTRKWSRAPALRGELNPSLQPYSPLRTQTVVGALLSPRLHTFPTMAANVPNNNDPIDEEDEPEDVIEGGVAHQHHDGDGSATSADLHLFLVCVEDLEDLYPAHPVLRKDVSVQIGLDKSAKFQAVMQRYLDVCNEAFPEYPVRLQDLEFAHATVLKGNETPEMAALMKNDRKCSTWWYVKVCIDEHF